MLAVDRGLQRCARLRPEIAMAGRSLSPILGRAGRGLELEGRSWRLRLRGLVTVTFADLSLRCPCSKQRVHSGLYDGLTWPDNGCASLD
jgi:hypothetical protein